MGDTEQNYVTLGEIRQTIIHAIIASDDMRAGHLHRLRNYLIERVQKDEERRMKKYPKYKRRLAKWKQLKLKHPEKTVKKPKNPKLNYSMIGVNTFADFIKKISDEYVPKIDGHAIVTGHDKSEDVCVLNPDDDDENMEHPEDMFCRIASVAICTVENADKYDAIQEDKEMDEEEENEDDVADKMKADIKKMKKNLDKLANEDGDDEKTEDVEEDEVGDDDDENKEEEKVSKSKHQYKDAHDSKKMNRRYKMVYDAILKKFEHRITLQQLIMFLLNMRQPKRMWKMRTQCFI